jgi:anion-transporting  ArsA/GET3 family ATPase
MNSPRRLYIFTGKGGVGKTTLSRAFVKELMKAGHPALYLTFKNQSIAEKNTASEDRNVGGIREIHLDLEDCARGYVEKRLGSRMLANWILKAPFFRALINMMPGFSYLIFLGKILEMGKENPKLSIVLDAPASGHALTMVESTSNFGEIFGSGLVFDDTVKMLSKLNDPEYTKIHVVSLPSLMSWQEATELQAGLKKRTPVEVDITINNYLYPLVDTKLEALPQGLREKALNEHKLIAQNQGRILCVLPHSLDETQLQIEDSLKNQLGTLI